MFVSSTNSVHLQLNKHVHFYLEVGLETSQKEQKVGGKFLQNFISSRMDLKKVQHKNKAEIGGVQEDYPTSAVYFLRMYRVVFLHSFVPALFVHFLQVDPYLK